MSNDRFKGHTALKITGSFVLLALIGSFLLNLPILQVPNDATYFDHLITATSLVCVSGLATVSIYETYNIYGQILALILIQIGGLGIITLLNVGLYYLRKRITLTEQHMLLESFNRDTSEDFTGFLLTIYRFTLSMELLGALILMLDFIPRWGWKQGSFNAIFTAVSAFSNAGFQNFPGKNLEVFQENPLVLLTISALVIAGGLGFAVWFEIYERFKQYRSHRPYSLRLAFRNMSIHTHVVLKMTVILLTTGTLLVWAVESRNIYSIGTLSFPHQLLNSFFASVNMRTAGYVTVNYYDLKPITKFVSMVHTLIGAGPGGTAGGLKVTTAAVLYLTFRSELLNYSHVIIRRRTISSVIQKRALVIVLFFTMMFIGGYSLLLLTQTHVAALDLMFEVVNALGTAGISLNLTARLSTFGHLVLMILMIAGRVGPITLLMSVLYHKSNEVHYAEANIYIG
ncbi:TrkH family potassium uptake protein [Hutsoniella sourekii]|uniref:TrkH family potassium uptake protein n=1 Tax=Hutsoniella sourekii TaxID=87650 RepID=UPI0004B348DC|nr:potassium transporter TrkG [Hutsoniella sourekii]